MTLHKNNLTIRNAMPADAEQLCLWWNDGSIMAHAGFPKGLNTTVDEIRRDIATDTDCTHRRHIIEYNNTPIGEMNYRNKGDGIAEIGIKICDFVQQEKGLGTMLLTMFIDELFNYYGYEKIVLDTSTENKRAQHVYEKKLGFRIVAVRKEAWRDQLGVMQSAIDYALTKDDWAKSKIANSNAEIIVRKAQLEDVPDLIKLNEKFNGVISTTEAMTDSIRNNKNEIVIVAICNDKAVGFVCGQIFKSICYPNCSIGEVTEMFVYKSYRRTGIATKIMQYLESEFVKNNVTEITLKTGRDNKKARKFYESCGYEKDDEIVYEKEILR